MKPTLAALTLRTETRKHSKIKQKKRAHVQTYIGNNVDVQWFYGSIIIKWKLRLSFD